MHDDLELLRSVVNGDRAAYNRFLELWVPRLHARWSHQRTGHRDFLHWLLTDWVTRPDNSFGNLARYVAERDAGTTPSFERWCARQAGWRLRDYMREKLAVCGRREVVLLDDNRADVAADGAALIAAGEAADALARHLDPEQLYGLGFCVEDGELRCRRGRRRRSVLSAALAIGTSLTALGFDVEDVRRGMAIFLDRLTTDPKPSGRDG